MTSGRVLRIKKTHFLRAFASTLFLVFVAFVFVAIFLLHAPALWFYAFCFLFGIYELTKSAFFKFDSCLYLGSLLFFVGISGFVCEYLSPNLFTIFIPACFMLSSLVTFAFTKQKFHLLIAFSILYVTIFSVLFSKKLISLKILLAFLIPFLLLLILEMIWQCFRKK